LESLKKQVAQTLTPDKILKNSLAKEFNSTLENVVKKEIVVGDKTFRVAKDDAGGFVLEKKAN
jgi:hypothetical protein